MKLRACTLLFLVLLPMMSQGETGTVSVVETEMLDTLPVAAPVFPWWNMLDENDIQEDGYFMKRPALGGRLSYEFKDESRTSGGTTTKDSYHKFKEQIILKTGGWVYHPALMQYRLMIEPEWTQGTEEKSPGETAEINSFSPDYSVLATFLQQKPYTLNVFSSRQDTPVWAPFAGNTESLIDTYGADVQFKYKVLPTTIGFAHVETDLSGFYSSQNSYDNYFLTSRQQSEKSYTTLNSSYRDDERTSDGVFTKIKTFNNSLLNIYHVTEDKSVTLNSALTYRNQDTTDLKTENTSLREHLNWLHRNNLQSNYIFGYSRQQTGDFDYDQTFLEGRLTHLLYENLTTDFGGRANMDNYDEGRENAYDVFLDFAYIRPLPWGTLNLSSGWDYCYTDRSGFTDTIAQVTNEAHSLSTSRETYLDNYNVDVASILVTNSPGTIVYLENIDYAVDQVNDFTRIRRLPFGAIPDGGVVAVSYRYLLDAAYDDTIFTENYGINLELWHDWWFSYNYLRRKQDILSGQPPQNLVDDTIHQGQVRYDIGWSDTSLSYEDSNRNSDLSYTSWEIGETLRYRPFWRFYFTLRGYLGRTEYQDINEQREFYGGITTLDWMLSRRCKFRVEGYYDNTKGDVEETVNTGIKADLEYRYRIWTLRLSYEMTDQDNKLSDYQRTEQLVRFDLIRIMW